MVLAIDRLLSSRSVLAWRFFLFLLLIQQKNWRRNRDSQWGASRIFCIIVTQRWTFEPSLPSFPRSVAPDSRSGLKLNTGSLKVSTLLIPHLDLLPGQWPPPQEWISTQITSALGNGTIVVRNPTLTSGQFLDDYPSREHHYGTVHNRSIYPGMLQIISAHASNGYRGTSGTIPLYEGSTLICSLYWDCPGSGGNSLQEYYVDGNYSITIGAFNASGPIGDVNITIQRA